MSSVSTSKELLLQRFIKQGYLVLPPELLAVSNNKDDGNGSVDHDSMYAQASNLFLNDKDPGNNILPQIPELYDNVFGPRNVHLDAALRLILGDDYLFHAHRRCHDTVPGRMSQGWHKDTYKGRQYQPNHAPVEWVMAMYYPQDVTVDLGPTELWPGSQYYRGDYGVDSETQRDHWNVSHKSMTCPKGTIVLIHFDIWHRAATNTSKPDENNQAQGTPGAVTQRFMFKFQFARMSFGSPKVSQRRQTTNNSMNDEYVCSQILKSLEKFDDIHLDVDLNKGKDTPSTLTGTTPTSFVLDTNLFASLDTSTLPKLLNEVKTLRHTATSTKAFQRGRGQLVKKALDEAIMITSTTVNTAKNSQHQQHHTEDPKILRKTILAHLNKNIDKCLDHYDQEQSAIRFVEDRRDIWNHAIWCYGYPISSSSCYPPKEEEDDEPEITTSSSSSSLLPSLKKKLLSPRENERLAAAYRLAALGDAIGVKLLLDMLMTNDTTTTPQRRTIVYGLIAAYKTAEDTVRALIQNVFTEWVEANIFNGEKTVATLLRRHDDGDGSDKLPLLRSFNSDCTSLFTSQARRGNEGFDFEFSKEATNKVEELHYCIIFILANSVFMEGSGRSGSGSGGGQHIGRLLLADCNFSLEKEQEQDEGSREELHSIQCVAVEGLGRWLSAAGPGTGAGYCLSQHVEIDDNDKNLALHLIASSLQSPCEDLRCAASLALARCPTPMILSMCSSSSQFFEEVITRQLNEDPCRYVRSYLFEVLVRSAGTLTTLINDEDVEEAKIRDIIVSTLSEHVHSQGRLHASQPADTREAYGRKQTILTEKLLSKDVDPSEKIYAARELAACRRCDLTTKKNRW